MENQLIDACKNGNVDEVKRFLKEPNINLNSQDESEDGAFNIACQERHIEIVKLLLNDNRVDVNKPDYRGATSFWIACQNSDIEIVKLLSNNERVDVNQVEDKYERTPFYIACQNGHVEVVEMLLNIEKVDINKAESGGETPFYKACEYGHLEIVKCILASDKEILLHKKSHNHQKTALDISKERSASTQSYPFESKEVYQKAKKNCPLIVELLESFQKNPSEIKLITRNEVKYRMFIYFLSQTS